MAARATFALKPGVWFRRARLLMVSPDSRAHRARRQAETPLSALCRFPEPALLLSLSPFVVLGEASYSLYLVHLIAYHVVAMSFGVLGATGFVLGVLLALLLALVLW